MSLNVQFIFDHKKGTQVLNYFAIKAGGEINKMKALKLVYFADKFHLRKYGRLITNDEYLAMRYGPVPSAVKDIAESNDFLEENSRTYSSSYVEPSDNLVIKSVSALDDTVFSESDIEALDFAWTQFGNLDQFELAELTIILNGNVGKTF